MRGSVKRVICGHPLVPVMLSLITGGRKTKVHFNIKRYIWCLKLWSQMTGGRKTVVVNNRFYYNLRSLKFNVLTAGLPGPASFPGSPPSTFPVTMGRVMFLIEPLLVFFSSVPSRV